MMSAKVMKYKEFIDFSKKQLAVVMYIMVEAVVQLYIILASLHIAVVSISSPKPEVSLSEL